MMYTLSDPLSTVSGVGPKTAAAFADRGILTVRDVLVSVPLRYEDRSQTVTISQVKQTLSDPKQQWTIIVTCQSTSSAYVRGKSMQRARFVDDEGESVAATWFNNPFIVKRLHTDGRYRLSGRVKMVGKMLTMTQPVVEEEDRDALHTGRLVPVYSTFDPIPSTTVRKIMKQLCDHLAEIPDPLTTLAPNAFTITQALRAIHFPDSADDALRARHRFAVEELIQLIQHSHRIKAKWNTTTVTTSLPSTLVPTIPPATIPFTLTAAQLRCSDEILSDLTQTTAMNRLLLGDVGSGKTVVAGIALAAVIEHGAHACLIAPTQVLAEQHARTLHTCFPLLPIEIVTSMIKPTQIPDRPTLFIGTHAVLNFLTKHLHAHPIGLVVFDEQHRFGVRQRSALQHLSPHPHMLTMTATPIPRSLMLSIFSHIALSVIDELPKNRIPTKSWVITPEKKAGMYDWLAEQIMQGKTGRQENGRTAELENRETEQLTLTTATAFQVLYVCPFINPSEHEALENVAAVKEKYEELKHYYSTINPQPFTLQILHGQQKKKEQAEIINALFAGKIDLLVTTPIVEVGIDLPQASAIVIDAAERFGLASLHQLRGRVGRAGQQGYCLLTPTHMSATTRERLSFFATTLSGMKVAEYDVQHRGAGNLFGVEQHGFDELQFADWSNLEDIATAKQIVDRLEQTHHAYQSILFPSTQVTDIPLAN